MRTGTLEFKYICLQLTQLTKGLLKEHCPFWRVIHTQLGYATVLEDLEELTHTIALALSYQIVNVHNA